MMKKIGGQKVTRKIKPTHGRKVLANGHFLFLWSVFDEVMQRELCWRIYLLQMHRPFFWFAWIPWVWNWALSSEDSQYLVWTGQKIVQGCVDGRNSHQSHYQVHATEAHYKRRSCPLTRWNDGIEMEFGGCSKRSCAPWHIRMKNVSAFSGGWSHPSHPLELVWSASRIPPCMWGSPVLVPVCERWCTWGLKYMFKSETGLMGH